MNRDELKKALNNEIADMDEAQLRSLIWIASPMGRPLISQTTELLFTACNHGKMQILELTEKHFGSSAN